MSQNIVYISRNEDLDNNYEDTVDIWVDKPTRDKEEAYDGIYFSSETCEKTSLRIEDFKKIFGYTPRRGSCQRKMPTMKSVI